MWRAAPCLSPFSSGFKAPCPLCCVSFSVPCLLFSYLFIYFFAGQGLVCPGPMLVYPRAGCGILRAAHLFTCWSASPKQVWSQHLAAQEPSWFLSVMWCGEALCSLGFRVWEFCFFLVVFFCQVWLQHLSKIFDYWSSCCLLPPSTHHLGFSSTILILNSWAWDGLPLSYAFINVIFPFSLSGRNIGAWTHGCSAGALPLK
jgi:hypothetical protein